ncbi:MAG: hypothetical protein M3Y72_14270, partial [Acidobacteriota bacterium]|nr:hypothetical protein [Acidobacteriota bacterium]
PTLLSIVGGHDTVVQGGAIFGLLRMSNSNLEAAQALNKILSQESSPLRKSVIQEIPSAGVTDTHLLARLGEFLFDKDPDLQRAALLAIDKCGSQAVAVNRDRIAAFARTSSDGEVAALAQKLLDELNEQ